MGLSTCKGHARSIRYPARRLCLGKSLWTTHLNVCMIANGVELFPLGGNSFSLCAFDFPMTTAIGVDAALYND